MVNKSLSESHDDKLKAVGLEKEAESVYLTHSLLHDRVDTVGAGCELLVEEGVHITNSLNNTKVHVH